MSVSVVLLMPEIRPNAFSNRNAGSKIPFGYENQRAAQRVSIMVPALPMAPEDTFAKVLVPHVPGQS